MKGWTNLEKPKALIQALRGKAPEILPTTPADKKNYETVIPVW